MCLFVLCRVLFSLNHNCDPCKTLYGPIFFFSYEGSQTCHRLAPRLRGKEFESWEFESCPILTLVILTRVGIRILSDSYPGRNSNPVQILTRVGIRILSDSYPGRNSNPVRFLPNPDSYPGRNSNLVRFLPG